MFADKNVLRRFSCLALCAFCARTIDRLDAQENHMISDGVLQKWQENMVNYGRDHGERLLKIKDDEDRDPALTATYYDAQRVFLQIADYTQNDRFLEYAKAANHIYRDRYVFKAEGRVPGYWNFTHGLAMNFARTKDPKSREAIVLLSNNMFAADSFDLKSTRSEERSREVAYVIMSYINAERVGLPRRARLQALLEVALGHIDQWFVQDSASEFAPFMFALTSEALIEYWEHVHKDPRILAAIRLGADRTWERAWIEERETFFYRADKRDPVSDLNLLIAPVYAWVYAQTGEEKYRQQGDKIFAGGVRSAWLEGPKQFNQNYRWSFNFVNWRQQANKRHGTAIPGDDTNSSSNAAPDVVETGSRSWTDATGRFSLLAEFVEFKNGSALFRKEDGKMIKVQMTKLSKQDQALIRDVLLRRRERQSPGK